jgi:hypothetical protein
MGFDGQASAHKANILPVNAKRRLEWCKERRRWAMDIWKGVIWSDESRYIMRRSNEKVWVWRLPGERLLSACILPTVKFGGVGIRVWRCFSWNILDSLVIQHGNINAERYKDILTYYVLSEILSFRTLSIVLVLKNKLRETRRFGNWISFRPQVREKTYSVGSLRKS